MAKAAYRSAGQTLQSRILAIGVLVVAALVGSAVFDSWRLHEHLDDWNERVLGNLARALSNEASRNFQSVDLLLKDTARWYVENGREMRPEQVQQVLAARARGLGQVSVLTIVDASGMQQFRSKSTREPLANVADRPYFQTQRDGQSVGLFINEPVVTRSEGVSSLVMSRRMEGAKGEFLGIATATVTLEEFRDMYATLQLTEGTSLLLTLDDGTLIARHPPVPDGDPSIKFPELNSFKDGPIIDRAISPFDGRAKLIAALPIGSQPLILSVTRDEDLAFRPWHEELQSAVVRTALLSLLIIFTIYGLLRQLKKLETAEHALRESEERYALTMDAADGGHAEWNIKTSATFLSEKWRSLHGVPQLPEASTLQEVVGAVTLHEEDRAKVRDTIALHLAGRLASIEIEYRILDTHGQWRWVHARAKSLFDERRAPVRVFCAATDVTEGREAASRKLELERRVQQTQRLESLGTLAGGIAHDFNNILGAILGFGEMAQQQAQHGTDLHRHIGRVMQAGDRAKLLVRRILDFSRSGVAVMSPVPIQAVVEEALAMLSPTLPLGIAIKSELHLGRTAVMGDATQLYQVVINLCANAVQAMGETGVLTLRLDLAQIEDSTKCMHGELAPGPYVRLTVGDTGSGIAAEVLPSIFNPFFTTKKGRDGTGLGLSVVHGVVTDHHGAIDVTSDVGSVNSGTTVTVYLPTQGTSADLSVEDEAQLPQGQGQAIMVVDDEAALVEIAEELLASIGYEPVGFHSAEAALQAFVANPERFDAVLTDEMLPGMPGRELARRLLALREHLPIVIMSGKVTPDLEESARAIGVKAVLHKPLRLKEMADALAHWTASTAAH